MCGIVGLYLKNQTLHSRLGELLSPMLVEMTDRGADSAGIAIYREPASAGFLKLTLYHPDPGFEWQNLLDALRNKTNITATLTLHDSHAVIEMEASLQSVSEAVARFDPDLMIMSAGRTIEIYKEKGLPADVVDRFEIAKMAGSHAVGHTRMATESAVTTAGSHPFSTGLDQCLVHNGSLSNHNLLRDNLRRHKGMKFQTENDTEVAAAYISNKLSEGRALHGALEDCLEDLDGFYTFVAGTETGFAVLRDPIACKPAVLAETDDFVAFGSEYRALVNLPDIENANVWEPEPAVVYSWGN
jgi:glutamate synthase domain-containing protein 1